MSLRAQIIAECEAYCQKILERVDSDVLGVETEHFIDASQATKSTVGLMVSSARPRTYRLSLLRATATDYCGSLSNRHRDV